MPHLRFNWFVTNTPLPLGLSILVEGVGGIQVRITEAKRQFVYILALLVAGNGKLWTNVVHLQLANGVDVALEVVLTEILHQLLYP